jgi:hypothetical protein
MTALARSSLLLNDSMTLDQMSRPAPALSAESATAAQPDAGVSPVHDLQTRVEEAAFRSFFEKEAAPVSHVHLLRPLALIVGVSLAGAALCIAVLQTGLF